MSRRALLIAPLITLLALAGCADDAGTPGTSSTSPATTTMSAAPTTTTVPPAVNDTTVVDSPREGDTVEGPTVVVRGEATAFEGTLSWLVHPVGGSPDAPTEQGSVMTGSNGEIAPFELTLELEPGAWVVQVFEASAKDGSPVRPVAVSFTVS